MVKRTTKTCNLLQTELKSDVARFTAHESNRLPTNQVVQFAKSCCRNQREKILFARKSVICNHVARFTGPRQTFFAASGLTPAYGVFPAQFYLIRSQLFTQLATATLFVAGQA